MRSLQRKYKQFNNKVRAKMEKSNDILQFYIENNKHTVRASDVNPETTLNEYLRENRFLTGTKFMCREGGCGTCIVSATFKQPITKRIVTLAVNSCLVSILSCSGWKISTVEGIGNPKIGYHPIQTKLANFNGTQCGFCSSGMVMNMYALYQNGNVNMKDVEDSFGGNICRCTGYRPILSAFKSMSIDASEKCIGKLRDIEDSYVPCKEMECPQLCNKSLSYSLNNTKWYKVFTIDEALEIMKTNDNYRFVAGNTARGVYPDMSKANVYIDLNNVEQLKGHVLNTKNLEIGANVTLTEAIDIFHTVSFNDPNFSYLQKFTEHIDLIAHVPVRNIGTLAGNLSIKHKHVEFPSDIFILLETVGATITIVDTAKKEYNISVLEYINYNMGKKIIKKITVPALKKNTSFESYKIMPRAQNAHAMVNAGFQVSFKNGGIVDSIRIVYGGINPQFSHPTETENFLKGRDLFKNDVLKMAYKKLESELQPDHVLPDPKPEFRKKLAIALFYKFILSICPTVDKAKQSGGTKLHRDLSKGTQHFETQESLYPLTEAIPKLEALAQTTGQAQYIGDIPDIPNQHYAAFILAKAPANSKIKKIDYSEALKLEGVVHHVDVNDIPGINSFMPKSIVPEAEPIFCSDTVLYYNQPIGLIVATSQIAAEEGAKLVSVQYIKSTEKPLLYIRDIIASGKSTKITHEETIVAKSKGKDIKLEFKGSYDTYWQYHYHMETQCCNVVPVEDGCFDMYTSTQWMDLVQVAAAECLNINQNKIHVRVRRLGGAYGGKISRNSQVACACILASAKIHKPVKLWMPFTDNMNAIGKRNPISADYEVGVNNKGKIQYLNHTYYTDVGYAKNEIPWHGGVDCFTGAYEDNSYEIDVMSTRSDNHTATWARAPGSLEGSAMIETIMEHISYKLNMDPLEVRLNNLDDTTHPKLRPMIDDLLNWAEVNDRKKAIEQFNKSNIWTKKALSVIPMVYKLIFFGQFHALISVYHNDGSVAISHGGIEMGQGINTKAAQVVAHTLGIKLDMVSVKPSDTLISPNNFVTGGSITSESVCMAMVKSCNELLERMKPIKDSLDVKTWINVVKECYNKNINLGVTTTWTEAESKEYFIYGVAAAEVEVDILTGCHVIQRVDLLEDTGDSMSPAIDIGQVEGAYIMGLGFWTCEEIVMDKHGELLTNRTWNYKTPGAKDIPVIFNVKFPENNPNPRSPLKAKATAEPPLCMSIGIPLAIKQAIKSARIQADPSADPWYPINGPCTVEQTFMSSLYKPEQYIL
ncbi:PREDICTED: indole-3-acetaldehyde oxidase-like [Nicrophorus vespilloides]|uniref:Indole-3-acetaldehyde oxidase-like n=1 Tax=Nicrophorus vespilloides TaxID=110193 RepID=A0ABM1M7R5_NICVS|nr:PREDICTED: indole-3-acetaldehyde oxidase-like [Nicrophorus vespilloides]